MLVAMALQGQDTGRQLAETERILADYRATRERLRRELEDLRANLQRVRDAARTEEAGNDV